MENLLLNVGNLNIIWKYSGLLLYESQNTNEENVTYLSTDKLATFEYWNVITVSYPLWYQLPNINSKKITYIITNIMNYYKL